MRWTRCWRTGAVAAAAAAAQGLAGGGGVSSHGVKSPGPCGCEVRCGPTGPACACALCFPARRDSVSLPPAPPNDPWSGREFLVKWKRYSYIHCSWNSRAALEHLRGYKRVLNYIKKVLWGLKAS